MAGFDNLEVFLGGAKRSMSPPLEPKDEPLGMLQNFENIQIQQNINPQSLFKPKDERVHKIVHKPNGFNISQFKTEFKQEAYESSRIQ